MSDAIRVELANDKQVYAPGDIVLGNVVINSQSELNANEIKARFRGKSHTFWHDAGRKVNFQKSEYYFDKTEVLWSKGHSATGSQELFFGVHRFPFSFQIPEGAPCSFEGGVGWVRYSVNVVVDIPSRFDKEHKHLITVLPKADLNNDGRAKLFPELKLKEGVGFLSTKYITIHASCNKGGYVPGELIDVVMKFNNESDKDISAIKLTLEQKAAFLGQVCNYDSYKGRRVHKKKAAKLSEALEVKSQSQRTWQGRIRVPSLPPSDLPGCSIIDLQYRLLVKVKCGFMSTIDFKIPFVIGTIPLASETSKDAIETPPSYLESVFGKVDGVENDHEVVEGNDYSPLYHYYHWDK